MLNSLFNWFVKITGFPAQLVCLRIKKYYESPEAKKIPKGALIVSNHTALLDYALYLFVFIGRTLRVPMAEVLFKNKLLKLFLKAMGGIFVNRSSADLSFVTSCADVLGNGGTVLIFPEGRLPRKSEERPLAFHPSVGMIALMSGAPVVPVYTNGSYLKRERAKVMIGEPFRPSLPDGTAGDKEKAEIITEQLRNKIIELGRELSEREKKK